MKKIVLLFGVLFLLTGCGIRKNDCIRLKQSYAKFVDFGYSNFYISKDTCNFFREFSIKKDRNEALLFITSPKIINPNYYTEFVTILDKFYKKGYKKNGYVLIELLDKNGKLIQKGTIVEKQFSYFLLEVKRLNEKYDIDNGTVGQINSFFDVIITGLRDDGSY